jgi:hypothetical protein
MGLGFGVREPGSGIDFFRIPDPGPGVKKAPDLGSGSATLPGSMVPGTEPYVPYLPVYTVYLKFALNLSWSILTEVERICYVKTKQKTTFLSDYAKPILCGLFRVLFLFNKISINSKVSRSTILIVFIMPEF